MCGKAWKSLGEGRRKSLLTAESRWDHKEVKGKEGIRKSPIKCHKPSTGQRKGGLHPRTKP